MNPYDQIWCVTKKEPSQETNVDFALFCVKIILNFQSNQVINPSKHNIFHFHVIKHRSLFGNKIITQCVIFKVIILIVKIVL